MIVCASSRRSQESYFFFFNDTATTEIYTLSLHDALPISGDIIVMMDADGSHDPHEIPLFVDALMQGADFAKGSRFIHDGRSEEHTSELQSQSNLVCRLLLEKKKRTKRRLLSCPASSRLNA